MAVNNFTAQWVERSKAPPVGRLDFFDDNVTGLGLRISHTGRKVWFVMYRVKGDPKRRRLTLDPFPNMTLADARNVARQVVTDAANGVDPGQEKQIEKGAVTFGVMAHEYVEKHAKLKKRSWAEDARVIEADLLPVWGRRKAQDISRRDVHKLLDGVVDRGSPIQANRILALVRKIFNWGIGRDIVDRNPCLMVKAPAKEKQRERVLTDDELRAMWNAFDQLSPITGGVFKLHLLTAQRGGEIKSMRWQDIDLNACNWTIPAEFSKNGRSHLVPLSSQAVDVLVELTDLTQNRDWVFPSKFRNDHHIQNLRKGAARVKKLTGIENFVPHDLRRTAASKMTSIGTPRLVVSKILNHVEQGVTQVYDRHSYDNEKREALDAWATSLSEITALVETV